MAEAATSCIRWFTATSRSVPTGPSSALDLDPELTASDLQHSTWFRFQIGSRTFAKRR